MTTTQELLKRPESFQLYDQLSEPKDVWKYFLMLTETPRPSHDLDLVRSKFLQIAEKIGCEASTDAAGNVLIRKNATPGFEHVPGVCMQGHMDMVTSANSNINIDFHKDPINVHLDGDWMKAKGTTLGADNGLGVAAALAILENAGKPDGPLPQHGLLEALITADEETTMGGAENLGPAPFVQSEILFNFDSEEEYAICIGCAGGAEFSFTLPLSRTAAEGDSECFLLSLTGLLGGHSGIEIHTGRANANKCLARILNVTRQKVDFRIVSLNGGGAPNVIPRESFAKVFVAEGDVAAFKVAALEAFHQVQQSYISVEHTINPETKQRESVMKLAIEHSDRAGGDPLDNHSTQKAIDWIENFYTGVIRMNQDVPGLVETSINFSNIDLAPDSNILKTHSFARSSSDLQLKAVYLQLASLSRLVGATVEGPLNGFPGWDPDVNSVALRELKQAHEEVMGSAPRVYAVHAGLECGLIQAVYPKMSCVSIGPEIHHAHSPDECLLVPSVDRFVKFAWRFLQRVAQLPK